MSNKIHLNNNWLFSENFCDDMINRDYNISSMEVVRIPHNNKNIQYNYFDEKEYQMICGYRKTFFAPKAWQNKKIILTFMGAAHVATVYINQAKVITHSCGYTSFSVDITDNIIFNQDNLICVRLDTTEKSNVPPFGGVIDYLTYGGIYREVYLEVKNNINIQDVFCYCNNPLDEEKILNSEVQINGFDENFCDDYIIKQTVLNYNQSDEIISTYEIKLEKAIEKIQHPLKVVKLWSTQNPHLYTVITEIYFKNEIKDRFYCKTAFRKAVFNKNGFYLNDEKVFLVGLNRHQSFPYVGYAMPKAMQERDADILKFQLGCNSVRTSHYPQSQHFINRCDEIGLLVFTEIPGWQHIGDKQWQTQAIENTKEMILQYRNNPSIILWGVRINESADDDEFYAKTNEVAKSFDPTRQTGGVRCHKNSSLLENVYTYNDFSYDGKYSQKSTGAEIKKNITSDNNKAYLISEHNGHMFPTKAYDCEEHRLEQALRHATVINSAKSQIEICGCFGWCMFDYNTHKDFGSGDKICYHGVLDMFRNQKISASVYSSMQDKTPVLEISSSMDIGEHPASRRGDIYAFTNCDSIKLYKNNVFIKEYKTENKEYPFLTHPPILIDDFVGNLLCEQERLTQTQSDMVKEILAFLSKDDIKNAPKEIKKICVNLKRKYNISFEKIMGFFNKYIGNWGEETAVYKFEGIMDNKAVIVQIKSALDNVNLKIDVSSDVLCDDITYDVSSINIKAVDNHDNILTYYVTPIALFVSGEIEVIGPKIITLQGGMGGTYIKTTGKGNGVLTIAPLNGKSISVDFKIL